ncbi:MAG: MFS transporter, partial [Planctomycetes bacterium]|nr:MFS transporter [Planctomycetota bacterium]
MTDPPTPPVNPPPAPPAEAASVPPAAAPPPALPAPPFPAPRWEIFSWCMFDFANSSFTTVIVTVVFSVYFADVVCAGRTDADFLWGLANALSQGVVLLTAPIVGAIADYSGAKKRFLTVSWLSCCVFTACLWFAEPGAVLLAMGFFILANIAYSAGENLTASFLPELARPEDMGKVSGYGWAWGYMGGLLSLALCIPLIRHGIDIGHSDDVRLTCLVISLFFFLAALPTIFGLRERKAPQPLPSGRGYVATGFSEVGRTLRGIRHHPELAKFLGVFLTYNCGIAIVVYFASIFAKSEIGLTPIEQILFFALLQITSAVGAFVFGFLQDRMGARTTIVVTLLLWIAVVSGCAVIPAGSKNLFYLLGNAAGLAIGASQSAARALVGVFSPPSRSAEYFGFWGLFWKLSSAIG